MKPYNRHVDKVKSFFDDNALVWRDLYLNDRVEKGSNVNDVVLRDRKNYSLRFLSSHLAHSSNILDVGCGTGVIALELLKLGYYVHGVDISPEMIDLSESTITNSGIDSGCYALSVGNIGELKLQANSFDAVVALGFIEYQENPLEMLNIFHRLMKPEGIMVLSSPLPLQIANWMGLISVAHKIKENLRSLIIQDKVTIQVTTSDISINRYNLRKLSRVLDLSGFAVINNVGHGFANIFPFDKLLPVSWNFMIHKALSKYSRYLFLDKFANNLIVVAKKK